VSDDIQVKDYVRRKNCDPHETRGGVVEEVWPARPGQALVLWLYDNRPNPQIVSCADIERMHGKIALADVKQVERGWPWAYVDGGFYYCARCKHLLGEPDRNDRIVCPSCRLSMQAFADGVRVTV